MSEPKNNKSIEYLKKSVIAAKKDKKVLKVLSDIGFSDPDHVFQSLSALAENPVNKKEFIELFSLLISFLKNSSVPDLALNYFERFVSNAFSQVRLYEILRRTPRTFEILIHLFSTSPALSEVLIRNPEYFDIFLDPHYLDKTWEKENFERELGAVLPNLKYWSSKLNALRRFKRRQMLRIGVRDLEGLAPIEETMRDISHLADVCIHAAFCISCDELQEKFGEPCSEINSDEICKFSIIGMGKLGGLELNYSSDIDIMFIYTEEGKTRGEKSIENHSFFSRLAEKILQVLGERTKEGYLYRVDTRLRPEGNTGPLVRSLESYETYYAAWGKTWERQALIKARWVAGDAELGQLFLTRIEPFVYRKFMDYPSIEEIRAVKIRIEHEVQKKEEQDRDVKLGWGGIREVEFGLQMLQLLYGGKNASLREASTMGAIQNLEKAGLIRPDEVLRIKEAYLFLRKIEHLLQLEYERQTHVLPLDKKKLEIFSHRLQYHTTDEFLIELDRHRHYVHQFYQELFSGLTTIKVSTTLESIFETALGLGQLTEEIRDILVSYGFKDAEGSFRSLISLAKGENSVDSTREPSRAFIEILSKLLETHKKVFDADQALTGLERFIASYKARKILFELFKTVPKILELLLMVFGISPFLTDILIKNPELFDILAGGFLDHPVEEGEMFNDFMDHLRAQSNFESKVSRLKDYGNLEFLKHGIRDVLGLNSRMEVLTDLSNLADHVMKAGLEISFLLFEEKYSKPRPLLAVLALGKFGGQELGFSSDLDVLFVSDGSLDQILEGNQLGASLIDVLSRSRGEGSLYKVDPRLRPDGVKGPLVPSLEACRDYYHNSNSVWERMALSRARFVAGDEKLGSEVMRLISNYVFSAALGTQEAEEIKNLRETIRKDRCGDLLPGYELKSGIGGILDIEFLAQFLLVKSQSLDCLESNTLKLLKNLTRSGLLAQEDRALLAEAYIFYREVENALRLVKDRSTDFIPRDSDLAMKVQKKMGLEPDPDRFFGKLDHFSHVVRYLFNKYIVV